MRISRSRWINVLFGVIVGLSISFFFRSPPSHELMDLSHWSSSPSSRFNTSFDPYNIKYTHLDAPLLFVGGWPRSGTTLMRVLLDVHSMVRCGPETRVIPRILTYYRKIKASQIEIKRLSAIKLFPDVIRLAFGAFILQVMGHNGRPAKLLCDKDPMNLKNIEDLVEIFPNAKFILMQRDGRAVVHSIIKRNVSIGGVKWNDPDQSLSAWERGSITMRTGCLKVGSQACMMVKYENLVLQPRVWLKRIIEFLRVPWEDNLLNHWNLIDKDKSVVQISGLEKSSDQVINPINLDALDAWYKDKILPEVFKNEAGMKSHLIRELGYDVYLPPKYGDPDPWVVELTEKLHRDQKDRRKKVG